MKNNLILFVSSSDAVAFVYEINPSGSWKQTARLNYPVKGIGRFGSSIASNRDCIVVGASGKIQAPHIEGTPYEKADTSAAASFESAGIAFLYKKENAHWVLKQQMVASDKKANASFGNSISMSDNLLCIGALSDPLDGSRNPKSEYSGAAYIFIPSKDGQWKEIKKITATPRKAWMKFGFSVSVSETSAIISCLFDDLDANGANPMHAAGSAYIFDAGTKSK